MSCLNKKGKDLKKNKKCFTKKKKKKKKKKRTVLPKNKTKSFCQKMNSVPNSVFRQ